MSRSGTRPFCCLSGLLLFLYACLMLQSGCPAHAIDSTNEMVLYGQTSRIKGFDPVRIGDVASATASAMIYEGLLQYSYLERPYRVEPLLADGMPVISDDGLTLTFKIRKGIYFQDDICFTATGGKGRELTAEDFVYSIKRAADIKSESTGYWVFNNRIAGLDDFRAASRGKAPTDYSRSVEGLQAPDRYTFRVKLSQPYPQLLWVLTMQYAFAVPHEAVEYYGDQFVNHPVGTGPFILEYWSRNYKVEFVRNPKWKETGRVDLYPVNGEKGDMEGGLLADAGKPIPFLDRIVNFVIDDTTTQWLKFVTGELESSGVSRDNWNAVIMQDGGLTDSLMKKGVRLFSRPTLDVYYIGFNMDDPVVGSNKKLRQALTCAFDTEKWVKFWNGRIERAKGPIPPNVAGYDDKAALFPYNPDMARKLLAEAGYADGIDKATGKPLVLTVELGNTDPQTREASELMREFFRQVGVQLKPSFNNWPTYLAKMERRQCQLYWLGWIADYPDAENFLQLFYGPNSSPGPNHSNYMNKEFDALYEKIRTMPDSPARTDLYKQMADIVVEDCPWIFMHNPLSYGLHHSWQGNYKPHDFPYGLVKYRRIDTAARSFWKATQGSKNWKD
jgi:oligopeptide transport system substrate-binding protein